MPRDEVVVDDPVVTDMRRWVTETLSLQLLMMRELEHAAASADNPQVRCLYWLQLLRHASGRLRTFDRFVGRWERLLPALVSKHRVTLEALAEGARRELHGVDERVLSTARARLGVRVAVIGKGGVGKTLISSTLARILGRRGRNVLAVDLDPNPGLAFGLGLPPTEAGLPREALDRDDDGGWQTMLAPGLHPMKAVERFAHHAPDGVRYLGIGKIADPERTAFRRSMGPLFQIVFNVADPRWDVVGDLEAGGSTPFQGYHYFAELVLLVVGPSWKSALTARRLEALLCGVPALVVANQYRGEADHPGLDPQARIPFDPKVTEADRLGLSPIDHCPDGPAVRAIGELADQLTSQEVLV